MKKIYVIAIASMISASAFAQQTMPQAFAARTRTVVARESSIDNAAEASMRKKKASAFGQGKSIVSIGYGFPNLGKSFFKTYESYSDYKVTGFGPMHIKYEYGVSDKIGLGLSVNIVTFKVAWTETPWSSADSTASYEHRIKSSAYSALARMNLHFATQAKIDPYWGFGLGYSGRKYTYETDDPNYPDDTFSLTNLIPLGFESTIGCRFYFTDNIGAYIEAGFSKSIVQGGLVAKF
jgi:opacity protein-like surface antigen